MTKEASIQVVKTDIKVPGMPDEFISNEFIYLWAGATICSIPLHSIKYGHNENDFIPEPDFAPETDWRESPIAKVIIDGKKKTVFLDGFLKAVNANVTAQQVIDIQINHLQKKAVKSGRWIYTVHPNEWGVCKSVYRNDMIPLWCIHNAPEGFMWNIAAASDCFSDAWGIAVLKHSGAGTLCQKFKRGKSEIFLVPTNPTAETPYVKKEEYWGF